MKICKCCICKVEDIHPWNKDGEPLCNNCLEDELERIHNELFGRS